MKIHTAKIHTALFRTAAVVTAASALGLMAAPAQADGTDARTADAVRLALRGVHFVPNQGQWTDGTVRYGFKTRGLDIAFGDSSLTMHLSRTPERGPSATETVGAFVPRLADRTSDRALLPASFSPPAPRSSALFVPPDQLTPRSQTPGELHDPFTTRTGEPAGRETLAITVSFPGSNDVRPRGIRPAQTRFNYFIGADESRWASGVPSYRAIIYENLYDGIDLHVMGARGVLKYEFHCRAGADYEQVRIRYDGIDTLHLDPSGDLHIRTPLGTLVDNAPYVWQDAGQARQDIPARFETIGSSTYTIALQTDPDPSLPLVIDPEIDWMYYFGGFGYDSGWNMTLDGAGNALVAGKTRSNNFAGRNNVYYGGEYGDAFALKVAPSGQLLWMTYLGGSELDEGWDIAVDNAGDALVTGFTNSTDFAGRNNSHHGGGRLGGDWDAFVVKVDASGQLRWMYYLGGTGPDYGEGVATDSTGNALIAGYTLSSDFTGRNNTLSDSWDAFLLKVSPTGQLQWMTYLGGGGDDTGRGTIAVDGVGNTFLTGTTESTDFVGRNNSHNGATHDAFALKVGPAGQLQWMTYLGGSGYDWGKAIALDAAGNVLVTGETDSFDFDGRNNAHKGGFGLDAFALKVSPAGQLQWMTYLGGTEHDIGHGIAADSAGNVLVTGETDSFDFDGRNNSNHSSWDAFALKVSPAGQLVGTTYLGGGRGDSGRGIAADSADSVLVIGGTSSTDFGGRNNSSYGDGDAFIVKLRVDDGCYADCDRSASPGVLDVFDFLCFQDSFFARGAYACNCDASTGWNVCDVFDFLCFQDAFLAGCP